MRHPLRTVVALALTTAVATPSPGSQAAAPSLSDSALRALETHLTDHTRVRVYTKWGPFELDQPGITLTRIDYRRVLSDTRFLPDSVTLPNPMPMTWVDAMATPRRRPVKWAFIGAATFGAAGLAIGALDKSAERQPTNTPFPGRDTGLSARSGALIFGSLGLAVGLTIGLVLTEWRVVYQTP